MATTASSRRESVGQWWQLRSRGERVVLALVTAVVAFSLGWLLIWQPLLQDTDRLMRQLAADRATLAEARRQADAIAGLARTAPGVAAGDPRAALDAALVEHGLKNAATSIERGDNERIRATFDRIGFDVLTSFLDALQKSAQLRPVELIATARVEPGQVRAELTLAH
jgi:type II secretory pathway component PulM